MKCYKYGYLCGIIRWIKRKNEVSRKNSQVAKIVRKEWLCKAKRCCPAILATICLTISYVYLSAFFSKSSTSIFLAFGTFLMALYASDLEYPKETRASSASSKSPFAAGISS